MKGANMYKLLDAVSIVVVISLLFAFSMLFGA